MLLLQPGADGRTALHLLALIGASTTLLRMVLRHPSTAQIGRWGGAWHAATDRGGSTALRVAFEQGHLEAAALLAASGGAATSAVAGADSGVDWDFSGFGQIGIPGIVEQQEGGPSYGPCRSHATW